MTTTTETTIQIENLRVSLQELEGASLLGPLAEEYIRYDRSTDLPLYERCIYLRKDYSLDEVSDLETDFTLWSQELGEIEVVEDGQFTLENQVFVICCENEIVAIQIV